MIGARPRRRVGRVDEERMVAHAGWRAGRGGLVAAALAICAGCAAPVAAGAPGISKGGLVPVAIPPARLAAALAPRRLALLVGYRSFDDPAWHPLRFPGADARDLAVVLRDPTRGAFDQVEVLADAPDRAEVRAALARLAGWSRDPEDTVVVYLSSHGTLARDATGQLHRYVVLRDTRMDDIPGTALSLDELEGDFERLRSRRKVLILAACHSGGGKSSLPEELSHELAGIKSGFLVRPIEEVSRASAVLAASDWGETAREDEKLGHDIYTYFLIEALRIGADRNGDGAVTASEAHDYARRMTYEYTGGRQRPTAETSEVGVDPIVLVGKVTRPGKPELYSYDPSLDGFEVRVDGRPLAELPGGVALDPGRHRVELAKGGGPPVFDGQVAIGTGQRIDLGDLLARGEGRWELGPRFALLSFLDAHSRQDVLGTVGGFGATASLRDWPARALELVLDGAVAAGQGVDRQALGAADYSYQVVTAGAALAWRIAPRWLHGGSFLVGPRLSAYWLDRRFTLQLARAPQQYFTATPGLLGAAEVPIGGGFAAGLELHGDWTVVKVNGQDRSTAFGELLLGVSYRFQ